VTAKVDDFYGLIIRRLAARGELPAGFHAPIPPSPRAAALRNPLGSENAGADPTADAGVVPSTPPGSGSLTGPGTPAGSPPA